MDDTNGPDNDTTRSPSPPDVMSKSTNISQSKTKSTNSGPRQASGAQTFQGRPSYAAMATKALSSEHLDSAAKASPGAASSRPLRTREDRPADNRLTAVPAAVLRDRQGTAHHGDISGFGVGVGAQSRTGQVSPRVVVVLHLWSSPMTLSYSLPPMQTTHKAVLRAPCLPLSPVIYLLRKKPEPHSVRM
jgi:hypothetical protein